MDLKKQLKKLSLSAPTEGKTSDALRLPYDNAILLMELKEVESCQKAKDKWGLMSMEQKKKIKNLEQKLNYS